LAHKVAPNQMSFEASGLIKQDPYEFWVTASTNIGEGQPTKSIVIAPSTRGIYQFTIVYTVDK